MTRGRSVFRVVLVSDPIGIPDVLAGEFSREIDRPWSETTSSIRSALVEVCGAHNIVEYDSIPSFIDNVREHRSDVVFPYWFGQRSRSRHGLLPAVCEAYGIRFVGADAFTKIVCNDKELSKVIVRNVGLSAPEGLQISVEADLERLSLIRYPAVVKPNFEGTSLGISSRNLVENAVEAEAIARNLLKTLQQPILIEQFIAGREASICLIGNYHSMQIVECIAWEINGDPAFLDNRLFTYDLKLDEELVAEPRLVTDMFKEATLAAAVRIFRSFDKVDAMRIDGRLSPDGFYVIELSPDVYLGPEGELSAAAAKHGLNYTGMIRLLLQNALESRA
jgi:D-alanine-D-alanine ligase